MFLSIKVSSYSVGLSTLFCSVNDMLSFHIFSICPVSDGRVSFIKSCQDALGL